MTGMHTKMKITKRQLRRIIKEEKAKILKESVTDMKTYEDFATKAARDISDMFYIDMMEFFDEEPDAFPRHQDTSHIATQEVWEEQVVNAQQDLDTSIAHAIEKVIQEVESRLHDGEYYHDTTSPYGEQ
jgi:hypothetical protein